MSTKTAKAMESAGRLYKVATDLSSDPVEKFFSILKFAQEAPLEETLEVYRQIKSKWLILAEITTAKSLTQSQKGKVEELITKALGDKICFLYEVDQKILGGIKVRVGDNVFDESVMAKIRDLTLN
jgi:F-type H+-transporting ATPase subunit delta